jgi:hypothetical protein
VQNLVSTWYSKHLIAMNEPPLLASTEAGEEAYRFLWLRSFGKPVAVRVVRGPGGVELVAVRLDGAGGYEPGKIELYRRRALDQTAWAALKGAINRARFDSLSSQADTGLDGADWIIERVAGGKYRLVERWSPEAKGPHAAFRAACEKFLDLAGRDFVTGDVY